VYSNPVKTEKDLVWAEKHGVQVTTADTIDELLKIKKFAPTMRILWRLSIQEENPEQLATVFSGKFGDDIVTIEQADKRFKEIKGMGIQLEGIHFHCGSA
jgi:diaminopimelate decarboxylase